METGYAMQIASVYGTHWRRSTSSTGRPAFDFDLWRRSGRLDPFVEAQLPLVLVHRRLDPAQLRFAGPGPGDGSDQPNPAITGAEIFIFALPFPADQVVAALRIDFDSPDLNLDASLTKGILSCCTEAEVSIGGQDLASYIDGLARSAKAEKKALPGLRGRRTGLPLERHHLVLIRELNDTRPPDDDVIMPILYGIEPPYRPEFVALRRPEGLNREEDAFGAVSGTVSFLYGHEDDVEKSVFLTTVQAVGTASRFQQIWQDAYHQVQEFQTSKQAKETGVQLRRDLETLADHMGNLELDLAFSVETAADLGLQTSTLSIDSFHHDLYEVMQIRTRAHTVSEMFVRLGGSIRSELTAIESRERQQEEQLREELEARRRLEREQEESRRLHGALALGVLSCVAAPLGFFVGFFGMNASQVHQNTSMWDWHVYHWVYLIAVLIALIPAAAFGALHGPTLWRRWRRPAV
ncbi:MAG TPA: hypothetical protein VMU51_12580 [Mycobacteriales bacterium]|nr:hypothetical protein [Mycobacteriales bacterium]